MYMLIYIYVQDMAKQESLLSGALTSLFVQTHQKLILKFAAIRREQQMQQNITSGASCCQEKKKTEREKKKLHNDLLQWFSNSFGREHCYKYCCQTRPRASPKIHC